MTIQLMSADEEKYITFVGLVQWAYDVVEQARRISDAVNHQTAFFLEQRRFDQVESAKRQYAIHSACHHFVIAVYKLLEHRGWAVAHGLCGGVDFSEIDQFSQNDILDLRNMREHIVEYFQGKGRTPTRWLVETPEYSIDADSLYDTIIGGRLDWAKFAAATERLLPMLLAQPIPYPAHA